MLPVHGKRSQKTGHVLPWCVLHNTCSVLGTLYSSLDYGLGIWGTLKFPGLVQGVLVECDYEKDGCIEEVADSSYLKAGFRVNAWMGGSFTITFDNGTIIDDYGENKKKIRHSTLAAT